MKAQKGSRGITHSFFNLFVRWSWVFNAMPQPLYPREVDLVPIEQEDGWASESIWTGVENLAATGIGSSS
jgi:hypothetical protein